MSRETKASPQELKIESKDLDQKQPVQENYRDLVYKAAKNPDKNQAKLDITNLLSFVTIDVTFGNLESAASRLAQEGDFEAVNFLRKEFHASLKKIVYGYARGGHFPEAKKILEENSNQKEVLLQWMAYGYIQGGYFAEAKQFLTDNVDDRASILRWMAFGYAQCGYADDAYQLLAENPHLSQGLLQVMAFGFALGRHVLWLNRLLTENPFFSLVRWKFYGYAFGGHVNEANEALAENYGQRLALLQEIIQGYSEGGHVTQANKTLIENPAQKRYLILWVVYGCCEGGHLAEANKLLELEKDSVERRFLIESLVDRLDKNTFLQVSTALQTLAIFTPAAQKAIVKEFMKKHKVEDAKHIDLVSLIPKASQLNRVMNKYHLNFNHALLWINSGLQLWLLLQPQLVRGRTFPKNIYLLVAKFLQPHRRTQDIFDIATKQKFALRTQPKILAPLEGYLNPSGFGLFHHHEGRAVTIAKAINNCTDLKEIKTILQNQKSLFEQGPKVNVDPNILDKRWTQKLENKKRGKFYDSIDKSLKVAEEEMKKLTL